MNHHPFPALNPTSNINIQKSINKTISKGNSFSTFKASDPSESNKKEETELPERKRERSPKPRSQRGEGEEGEENAGRIHL